MVNGGGGNVSSLQAQADGACQDEVCSLELIASSSVSSMHATIGAFRDEICSFEITSYV